MKKIFSEKWKIEKMKKKMKKVTFFRSLFFLSKILKKWLFRFFRFSIVYENNFFIEKIIISGRKKNVFFYHISCPNPASGVVQLALCRPWAHQPHPSKSEKSCFLMILWSFFNQKCNKFCSSGLVWALRSGFEARPTSNGPSSELKRSYEDFRSTTLHNWRVLSIVHVSRAIGDFQMRI